MTEYFSTPEYPDGVMLGQASSSYVGMYGTTPITQRTSSSQAKVSTTAITAVSTTAALSTVSATTAAVYGFSTAAQADAIVAAVNSLITQSSANMVLVNELRAALVAVGSIKGS